MAPISKSTFLQFQICPKDTWLRLHKPELVETFIAQALRAYCGLDSYAMFAIWRKLQRVVERA
jgi:hypothetical protein